MLKNKSGTDIGAASKSLRFLSINLLQLISTKEWFGLFIFNMKVVFGILQQMRGDNGHGMEKFQIIKGLQDSGRLLY